MVERSFERPKIRVLSLKQPWAWAVLNLGKDVENRVWNTNHRGPFLIHASAGMTRAYYEDAVRGIEHVYGMPRAAIGVPSPAELKAQMGGIVGRACVSGVVLPHKGVLGVDTLIKWHFQDQYGFLLEHVEPLKFYPWPGWQRFFYADLATITDFYPDIPTWEAAMRGRYARP